MCGAVWKFAKKRDLGQMYMCPNFWTNCIENLFHGVWSSLRPPLLVQSAAFIWNTWLDQNVTPLQTKISIIYFRSELINFLTCKLLVPRPSIARSVSVWLNLLGSSKFAPRHGWMSVTKSIKNVTRLFVWCRHQSIVLRGVRFAMILSVEKAML